MSKCTILHCQSTSMHLYARCPACLPAHSTFHIYDCRGAPCLVWNIHSICSKDRQQVRVRHPVLTGIMVMLTSGYSITRFNEWKKIATCKLPGLFWWQVSTCDSKDRMRKDSTFSLFSSCRFPVIMINSPAKFITAFQSRFSAVCNLARLHKKLKYWAAVEAVRRF